MAVRIRLSRLGTNNKPFSRIVVADSTAPRDGQYIEVIGHYDPRRGRKTANLKKERLLYWLSRGALPTNTVRNLIKVAGAGSLSRRNEAV